MKYWIKAVAADLLIAWALYAWLALEFEGAGRVALFVLWFVGVARVLIGILGDKSWFKEKRPVGFGVYHAATDFAVVCLMVWFEQIALGTTLALGYFLIETAGNKEPKSKEKQ